MAGRTKRSRDPEPLAAGDLPERVRSRLAEADPEAAEIEDSFTETEEQARERKARQARLKRARWEERLPDMFRDATLDDFADQPGTLELLHRALSDNKVLNVVLAGPVGTGKTHAAYALGRMAVSAGRWVEAWSVHDLMVEMLPSAADPGLMEARAKNCHLLILDDLAATRLTDYTVDTITAIIDYRVSHLARTMLTTNVSEPRLREVWGERLVDRLRYGLLAIEFAGPSRRRPAW